MGSSGDSSPGPERVNYVTKEDEIKNVFNISKVKKEINVFLFLSFCLSKPSTCLVVSADGQTPRLDLNSANPWIVISQDLRTATQTGTEQPYPEHPDRFDRYTQVSSSESFSSGRHYWEVDVSLCSWCRIGICLNSMGRKGEREVCVFGGGVVKT